MDIQAGDKVTYEVERIKYTEIISNRGLAEKLNSDPRYEILKIERPVYNVIEEKKELLTEEEKEFLICITNFFEITTILFYDDYIDFYKNCEVIVCSDRPKELKFKGLEKNKQYTLKELGLE